MKMTPHYKGHRWTQSEIVGLMGLWAKGKSPDEIAEALHVTSKAVATMVVRLRKQGIPLERRKRGHIAGRGCKPWTQAEVEYLIRRRRERATMDEIAHDLGRTLYGIQGMIQKMRGEEVPVPMFGMGVRRLYDVNALRATFLSVPTDGLASEESAPSTVGRAR